MDPARSAKDKTIRFDAVNFLRVMAACMVFLMHVTIFIKNPGGDGGSWLGILAYPSAWAGVWIFFFLSGYLCNAGFRSGRYPLTWRGVGTFYLRRVRRLWLPTMGFLLVCFVLIYPFFLHDHPEQLTAILTATYTGGVGETGFSAAWFVFTLLWLNLFAPLFALLLEKCREKPRALFAIFFALLLFGFLYRLLAGHAGWDWYSRIYVPAYANLDLFVCGMAANALIAFCRERGRAPGRALIVCAALLLGVTVLFAGYVNWKELLQPHRIVVPTLTLVSTALFCYAFDRGEDSPSAPFKSLRGFAFRGVNWFSRLAFAFYLLHSLILSTFSYSIMVNSRTLEYCLLVGSTFLFGIIFAYGWTRIWETRR